MNKKQRTYLYGFGWKRREVTIQVGLIYEIQPLNLNKNRGNRGRRCIVLGFKGKSTPWDSDSERVKVKWQDDSRIAFVEPTDLVPVSPMNN